MRSNEGGCAALIHPTILLKKKSEDLSCKRLNPVFTAILADHLDEFVDEPFAEFCIFDDLCEFLVKEGVAPLAVDLTMRIGEVERDELGKVTRDGVFPRRVVVVIGGRMIRILLWLNIRKK